MTFNHLGTDKGIFILSNYDLIHALGTWVSVGESRETFVLLFTIFNHRDNLLDRKPGAMWFIGDCETVLAIQRKLDITTPVTPKPHLRKTRNGFVGY